MTEPAVPIVNLPRAERLPSRRSLRTDSTVSPSPLPGSPPAGAAFRFSSAVGRLLHSAGMAPFWRRRPSNGGRASKAAAVTPRDTGEAHPMLAGIIDHVEDGILLVSR